MAVLHLTLKKLHKISSKRLLWWFLFLERHLQSQECLVSVQRACFPIGLTIDRNITVTGCSHGEPERAHNTYWDRTSTSCQHYSMLEASLWTACSYTCITECYCHCATDYSMRLMNCLQLFLNWDIKIKEFSGIFSCNVLIQTFPAPTTLSVFAAAILLSQLTLLVINSGCL